MNQRNAAYHTSVEKIQDLNVYKWTNLKYVSVLFIDTTIGPPPQHLHINVSFERYLKLNFQFPLYTPFVWASEYCSKLAYGGEGRAL